jgi:hypothetical protein
MVSIAGMAKGTVFNVTQQRVKISSSGRSIAARTSAEVELNDEVLTSALNRGDVVLLSQQQETSAPKPEEPVAAPEPEPVVQAEPESEAEPEVQEQADAGEAEEATPAAEEEPEAEGEEPKTKKSTKTKVAKEN